MVVPAMDALRRHMKRRAIIQGAYREDQWEYPDEAIREALVNALGHRDLSAQARGTAVRIEMYPDRLTIRNPGVLFGSVSVDDLGQPGISSARNGALMKLLEDTPALPGNRVVCENRGSGVRAMVDSLRQAGMSPPQFEDRIPTFIVTFAARVDRLAPAPVFGTFEPGVQYHATTPQPAAFGRVHQGKPSDSDARPITLSAEERILALLDERGEMSRAEIAAMLGMADATARKRLTRPRAQGMAAITTDAARSRNTRYRRVPKP